VQYLGRAVVDKMVISHGDMDHIGGADAIVAALDVKDRAGAGSDHPCRAGQHWRWDGVDFEFLYPSENEAADASTSNARSCVLRIHGSQGSMLLAGDIEAPGERNLVGRVGHDLRSDVLVVPHHGSAT